MIIIPKYNITLEEFINKVFTQARKGINLKYEFHHNLTFYNNSFSKILFLL